jgi:hypothetical protein
LTQEIHSATSLKTTFFIVTAVKTSYRTNDKLFLETFVIFGEAVRIEPLDTVFSSGLIVPGPVDK